MPQWRVHLTGQQFDLEWLREIFANNDPTIIQDDSNYLENAAYLHSKETAPLTIGIVVRIVEKRSCLLLTVRTRN